MGDSPTDLRPQAELDPSPAITAVPDAIARAASPEDKWHGAVFKAAQEAEEAVLRAVKSMSQALIEPSDTESQTK
jgi:hypothetical protein